MTQSPPNALHYAGFTVQKASTYETPVVFIKFASFKGNAEIETADDKGHTGTRSLLIGEDRTKATAAPEIEDKFRPGLGFEDYFYHLLGSYTKTTSGLKTVTFVISPSADTELPLVSIIHGFNFGTDKARGFANSIANEMELKMSASEAPTVNMKYSSDFPTFNVVEPILTFPDPLTAPASFKAGQLSAFMTSGGTEINELTDDVGCLTEASVTISNNIELSVCAGSKLGATDKDIGELTLEGSMTVKYNDKTKGLEAEWATGSSSGTGVTYTTLSKALRFKYVGDKIETIVGEPATDTFYTFILDIARIDITSVKPSEDGDGSKTIEIAFKGSASLAGTNLVQATIISTLTDMHKTP